MPLYDFKCDMCDVVIEAFLHTAKDTRQCPKCGKEMRRLFPRWGMLKMKGEGGYPFRQKQHRGTAPYVA